jgi:hypothetical protein
MIFQSARLVMMLAFMLVSLACLLVLLILSIAPHVESTNPCTQWAGGASVEKEVAVMRFPMASEVGVMEQVWLLL